MYRDTPQPVYLKDYRPPAFLIERVALRFELDLRTTLVDSELWLRRNPAAIRDGDDLRLDGEQLELESIAIDGRALGSDEYRLEEGGLILRRVPDRFRLATRARIHPERNTALEGLYQSNGMLCTQCEAEGFRRIAWFLDRPDAMARFETTLVADRTRFPVLLSNGNLCETRTLDDGRHLARWEDPFPKPCYLFALIAGDLGLVEDRFVTASGREVALRIYVEPHNLDKCDHAMRALRQAMRWDEERYGREYDLDVFMIVAVSHFNMGAMENKGLNVFNDKFVLARPDTATDQDFLGIETVIAHEYFHNWTGNRVTCRDWFQLSLKEGFTVYRDQEFSADLGSRGVKRIDDVRLLRTQQFAEDAGPMAHAVQPEAYLEINNFYTATVYNKGAELVRMLAGLLGPRDFRRATDLYFERHDGQAVTAEDFVRCLEDASGRDLVQFRRWYVQAGTPEVELEASHDPAAGILTLVLRQSTPPTPGQPCKEPLHIPFALGLLDAAGRDLPPRLEGEPPTAVAPGTRLLELRQTVEIFRFVGLPSRPVLSPLRGFSAPVRLRYAADDAELLLRLAHDSDGFNRWDAAQTLMQRLLLGRVEDPARAVPDAFLEALRQALRTPDDDPALLAEILTLPSEVDLAEQMSTVDVDGIHRAREGLRRTIGAALAAELDAVYRDHAGSPDYAPTPEAMGRRALRNLALDYRVASGEAGPLEQARVQFETARNMTDAMAALRLLVDGDGAAGEAALAAFHQRWSHEPLVLDKWFAVQATSPRAGTLARIQALLGHPDFALTNPNRVRALIGNFCHANPVRFHAVDGGGYRFLADRVRELDPLNPQIAARLLRSLIRWRRFDPARQPLMRAELERLLTTERLSRDVFEIVSKALD